MCAIFIHDISCLGENKLCFLNFFLLKGNITFLKCSTALLMSFADAVAPFSDRALMAEMEPNRYQ